MQVGFAEVVVTPPLGTHLAGYFEERLADGVLDDLYSRALVASDGASTVALVVTDLLCVPQQDLDAMRELVTAQTGIPGNSIILAATHTHTGPITTVRPGQERNEDYMRSWAKLTAEAVAQAFHNRTEVTLGADKGAFPGLAFNRRYRMKNGYVHTNPGLQNPEIVEVAGPVDPEVTVVRFDDSDGIPVALLIHYACHPDTIGGTKISADWPGVAVKNIRQLLSVPGERDLGVIVLNGACGNINHIDVSRAVAEKPWPRAVENIGLGVAAKAAELAVAIETEHYNQVAAASQEVELERIPTQQFLVESKEALADPRVGRMEQMRAKANLRSAGSAAEEPDRFSVEVTCLRIGPAAIASIPGEAFTEYGLKFKEACPLPYPMMANLSNGYLGYIPTERAYKEGGYEGRSTRLKGGSGERLTDAAISLARTLA